MSESETVIALCKRITELEGIIASTNGEAVLDYHDLIEASLEPFLILDDEGVIVDLNKAFESATGKPVESVRHTMFADHFEDSAVAAECIDRVFMHGYVREYPLRLMHSSGSVIDALFNASVSKRSANSHLFVTLRTSYLNQQTLEALIVNDAILKKAQEITHTGSWYIGSDPNAVTWSEEIFKILEVPRDKPFSYNDFLSCIHPDDLPQILKSWDAAVKEKKPFRQEHRIIARGSVKWVLGTGELTFDGDRLIRGIGTIQDITDAKEIEEIMRMTEQRLEEEIVYRTGALTDKTKKLKEANDKLQELDKLKSLFIASMNHELRTPLNSVIGYSDILSLGVSGPLNEQQQKHIGIIKGSAEHLLALINDIIDISKIEAGLFKASVEAVNAGDVIRQVVETLLPSVPKSLTISADVPDAIVKTDSRKLKQIVINLVNNAIKYSDMGQIVVSITERDSDVIISVKDTGIGISEENQRNLFQAFSQIHTSGRHREGSGLGLYLSKKTMQLLGGDVTVTSQLGVGSTFSIVVPK